MADNDRPGTAEEPRPSEGTDDASSEGGNGGRSVTGAVKGAAEAAKEAKEEVKTTAEGVPGDLKTVLRDAQQTIIDEVKSAIAQTTSETVAPAARKATTSALTYVVTKGPGLVQSAARTTVAPRLKQAGGVKAITGTVLSKAPGAITKVGGAVSQVAGAGGALRSRLRSGRGRRPPLQGEIDVAVPLEAAYNQWTRFEEFPKSIRPAEILERRSNERIVWRSTSGPRNLGVVTFHPLAERLTRLQVDLDVQPVGLIGRTGVAWRTATRGLETDLRRFRAYLEMQAAATGAVEEGEAGEQGEQQPAEGQRPAGEEPSAEAQVEGEPPEQPEGKGQPGGEPQAKAEQPESEQPPQPSEQAGTGSSAPQDEEASGNGAAS